MPPGLPFPVGLHGRGLGEAGLWQGLPGTATLGPKFPCAQPCTAGGQRLAGCFSDLGPRTGPFLPVGAAHGGA